MHSLSATRSDARAASIIRARPKPVGLSCRLTLRTVIRPTKLMVKCLRADDRHALARNPREVVTDRLKSYPGALREMKQKGELWGVGAWMLAISKEIRYLAYSSVSPILLYSQELS